ncbi:MAG TPA: hypothetical protein VFO82_09600, partial [Steroidobacteraceae bacterium]|nr:hypothetical protein [Steroidobacteraceae bacterium]
MLWGPIDASAQGRARLSRDLVQQLQSVAETATCVIVPGTRAQVDGLAARHGLTIRKRLKGAAVLEIPAGALAAVAADAGLDSLTSNYRLRPHMAVTTSAIGADQVWSAGWAAGAP